MTTYFDRFFAEKDLPVQKFKCRHSNHGSPGHGHNAHVQDARMHKVVSANLAALAAALSPERLGQEEAE